MRYLEQWRNGFYACSGSRSGLCRLARFGPAEALGEEQEKIQKRGASVETKRSQNELAGTVQEGDCAYVVHYKATTLSNDHSTLQFLLPSHDHHAATTCPSGSKRMEHAYSYTNPRSHAYVSIKAATTAYRMSRVGA
jgi:hypothetical protein